MQQNWKSMQFNLEQAVTGKARFSTSQSKIFPLVPSTAYSQIMVDAYKKFILVCFLRGVHVQTALPKYTNNNRYEIHTMNHFRAFGINQYYPA